MIHHLLSLKAKHISGVEDVLVDNISRIFTNNVVVTFNNLMKEFPQIKYWNTFLLS